MSGTPVPAGVYRGAAASIAPVQAYEAFLGRDVSYVLAFAADAPSSWDQFEQAVLASRTNGPPGTTPAAAWAPLLGRRTLLLAVPACCLGTSWAQEAAGANDAHWRALARNLAASGLGTCMLRIGREMNGGWYRWTANPGSVISYRAGYARIVSVMRDAGFGGTFMWSPYIGQGTMGPRQGTENLYPGDAAVDVIGVDLYDGPDPAYPRGTPARSAAEHQAAWNRVQPSSAWDGLAGWHNLAVDHGKPLAYPEWGLRLWNDGGVYAGGGDNPYLISSMAAWMESTGAFMHGFWEDAGMGVSDPDDLPGRIVAVPASRAAFLRYFGG